MFSYKLALLATDMAAAMGAAVIGSWIVGQGAIAGMGALQQALFLVLCLTPIAFFPNFHLYSYHLIYFPRRHLMQLAKACGLGLFTIVIMTLTYKWPEFMSPDLFIPCVVAFSLAVLLINCLLINRFMEDKIVVLLKALGMALFGCLLAVFALAVVRCIVAHLLFNVVLRRHFRRQVLLIGMNKDAERITDLIIRQKAPFWIAGTVSPSPSDRLLAAVPKSNLG